MDDSIIIKLYNKRDERAIEESSKKYGNYCYIIAYNILADEQDAEECLDDTWLGAWNSIPPAQPKNLRLYLSKITRNLSLEKYRNKTREKRGGGEVALALDEIGELTAVTAGVEDEVTERELGQAINRFLRSLSRRERNIFLRRYYYLDSVSDIARRFDMRQDNVLVTLSRTRKKLKEYLEGEGYTV